MFQFNAEERKGMVVRAIDDLTDIILAVGGSLERELELPQIVVIGAQSVGKSSVLEGCVGREFLPRGPGLVTRRPIILRMHKCPVDDELRRQKAVGESDWVEFVHKKGEIFTDFEQVSREIKGETDRHEGCRGNNICDDPIRLSIYSKKVINMSLVDLPGITKVAEGEQPDNIQTLLRNMAQKYIQNENTIILAVTKADDELPNSTAIEEARKYDPEFKRTLVVLTNVDEAHQKKKKSLKQYLAGKQGIRNLAPKLIIGVVNRSEADLDNSVTMEECRDNEHNFFHNEYPDLAYRHGMPFLANTLSQMLLEKIDQYLPHLQTRVTEKIHKCRDELCTFSEPVRDAPNMLFKLINQFVDSYKKMFSGKEQKDNADDAELLNKPFIIYGRARIEHVFHKIYAEEMRKLNIIEGLQIADIYRSYSSSQGVPEDIYAHSEPFISNIKHAVQRMEAPSLRCVDLVYGEMLTVIQQCGVKELKDRFPRLYRRISELVKQTLDKQLEPTRNFVRTQVNCHKAYVNTFHPEFLKHVVTIKRHGDAFESLVDMGWEQMTLEDVEIYGQQPLVFYLPQFVAVDTNWKQRKGDTDNNTSASVDDKLSEKKERGIGKKGKSKKASTTQNDTNEAGATLGSDSTKTNNGGLGHDHENTAEEIEQQLPEPIKMEFRNQLRYIKCYVQIVRKNVQDIVPKAITELLINTTLNCLQPELSTQLCYHSGDVELLLAEDEQTVKRRDELVKNIQALEQANNRIVEIQNSH